MRTRTSRTRRARRIKRARRIRRAGELEGIIDGLGPEDGEELDDGLGFLDNEFSQY